MRTPPDHDHDPARDAPPGPERFRDQDHELRTRECPSRALIILRGQKTVWLGEVGYKGCHGAQAAGVEGDLLADVEAGAARAQVAHEVDDAVQLVGLEG